MWLGIAGLVLIIIGWVIQLLSIKEKDREIKLPFIMIYSAGVLLLVVDNYLSGLMELALLNFVCMLTAALVLVRVITVGKKGAKKRKG
ncbi:hypothetical protein KAW38_04960 [Candidatus Micrarchaeota archaeon]|nr:hypothetical protein [Candidatus Micrarchaeota archaeon]